jgi:hypothetical protein
MPLPLKERAPILQSLKPNQQPGRLAKVRIPTVKRLSAVARREPELCDSRGSFAAQAQELNKPL